MAPRNERTTEFGNEDSIEDFNPTAYIFESFSLSEVNEIRLSFSEENDSSDTSEHLHGEFTRNSDDEMDSFVTTEPPEFDESILNSYEEMNPRGMPESVESADIDEFVDNLPDEMNPHDMPDSSEYAELVEFIDNSHDELNPHSQCEPPKLSELFEFALNLRDVRIENILSFCSTTLRFIIQLLIDEYRMDMYHNTQLMRCIVTLKNLDCERNRTSEEARVEDVHFSKCYYYLTFIYLSFHNRNSHISAELISRCIVLLRRYDLDHEIFMILMRVYELAGWTYLYFGMFGEALPHLYNAEELYASYINKNDVHGISSDPLYILNIPHDDDRHLWNGEKDDIPTRLKKIYFTILRYLMAVYNTKYYKELFKHKCVRYQHMYLREQLPLLDDETWYKPSQKYLWIKVSLHSAECLLTLNRLEEARDHIAAARYMFDTIPENHSLREYTILEGIINIFWVRYGIFLLRLSSKRSCDDWKINECCDVKHMTPTVTKIPKSEEIQPSTLLFSKIERDLKKYKLLFPDKPISDLHDATTILKNILLCLNKAGEEIWYYLHGTTGYLGIVNVYKVELYQYIAYYYLTSVHGLIPFWRCGELLDNFITKEDGNENDIENSKDTSKESRKVNSEEDYLLFLLRHVAATIELSSELAKQKINGLIPDIIVKKYSKELKDTYHECAHTTQLSDALINFPNYPKKIICVDEAPYVSSIYSQIYK